jgi:hypothetical protein
VRARSGSIRNGRPSVTQTRRKLTLVLGLTLLANVADFFGTIGFVWTILKHRLDIDQYFSGISELAALHTWYKFFWERGLLAVAATCIFASFSLGKREGRRIFTVAQSLFPRSKTPRAVSELRVAILAPAVVLAYLVNLFLMAYFVENVTILALLVALVYVISMGSNNLQRNGLIKYLNDSSYMPSEQSDDYTYIMECRRIVREYLVDNYHQTREIVAFAGCVTIALLSWKARDIPPWTYYISISAIVALNELVVYLWRNRRDIALLAVEG